MGGGLVSHTEWRKVLQKSSEHAIAAINGEQLPPAIGGGGVSKTLRSWKYHAES